MNREDGGFARPAFSTGRDWEGSNDALLDASILHNARSLVGDRAYLWDALARRKGTLLRRVAGLQTGSLKPVYFFACIRICFVNRMPHRPLFYVGPLRRRMAPSPLPLRRALSIVVSEQPTRSATRTVVAACHHMARAYLRTRQRAGNLAPRLLACSLDDLAFDGIADLFERDSAGRFPVLQRYFEDVEVASASEAEAIGALRRLAFSAVGDRLFECYRAADPSLGRIIRTVKRTARGLDTCTLHRHQGQLLLMVGGATQEPAGRPLPAERMEAALAPHVAESTCTRDLVRAAAAILTETPAHPSWYPVSRLAQAIRGATVRVGDAARSDPQVVHAADDRFRADELQQFLQESVQAVKTAKRASYVGPSLSAETYDTYFAAIETYLRAQLIPEGRPWLTQHEALAEHFRGLSRDAYRAAHRSRFEYLVRQTRDDFTERVRAAWVRGEPPLEDPPDAVPPRAALGEHSSRNDVQHDTGTGRTSR